MFLYAVNGSAINIKMAAAVRKLVYNCARKSKENAVISGLVKTSLNASINSRCRYSQAAAKSVDGRPNWVVTTDDGRTIVCWHPEQEIPYECTKPLPILETLLNEEDSELKIQYRLDYVNRGNVFDTPNAAINALNLAKFTYTNKHRWFPQNDKRFRKSNPPVDREGI